MHYPRTEDLLTLRDGEPADAAKLERLRAAPGTSYAVARLERMRDALRALPELEAPPGHWPRIEARLAEPAPVVAHAPAHGAVAARAFGCAAVFALAVIAAWFAITSAPRDTTLPLRADAVLPTPGGATPTGEALRDEGGLVADTLRPSDPRLDRVVELPPADGVESSYDRLRRESAALEQMLGTISFQRAAMSGATASAIAGLEDRIASIDAFMATSELPADSQATLMGVRVNLLEALVNVRLAQARPMPF